MQKNNNKKYGSKRLRAILEEIMTGVMFDIPSESNIENVLFMRIVLLKGEPELIINENKALKVVTRKSRVRKESVS